MTEQLKRRQAAAERYIFPLILALYPFVGMLNGFSLKDSGYNLSGFLFGELLDRMWLLATYLAQVTGALFIRLPFGDSYAGMQVYCTMPIVICALLCYYLLRRFELPRWMIFCGEFVAVSLCWCPRVILYNYLTYLLYTAGTLLLLRGLVAEKGKRIRLFFAGVALGANVFVRFPNVCECLMIVCVIAYGVWEHQAKGEVFREIILCFGGYLAGLLLPFIAIRIQYGIDAYPQMIAQLFSMTREAEGHGAGMMLWLILQAYGRTLSHMAVMLPCMAAGVLMFVWKKDAFLAVKRWLYVAGLILLVLYYFKTGVFTRNYWYYDCMFQAAMMCVVFACILFAADIAGFLEGHAHERLLSLAALMTVLITPLGSDNYTYPVLNNLFLVAPAGFCVFRRALRRASAHTYREAHFTWASMMAAVGCVLLIQGTLFHVRFSFDDGMDGTRRDTRIGSIEKLEGVVTTAEQAAHLEGLQRLFAEQGLSGKESLLFGDIPGLAWLFDLPPAIFTTWPDLDSNTVARFDEALESLEREPLIVIRGDGTGRTHSERKYVLLQNYILQHSYDRIYDDGVFAVYQTRKGGTE